MATASAPPPTQGKEEEVILPLEAAATKLEAGATEAKSSWGTVVVSNPEGKARNNICLTARFQVHPDVLYSIFTYPDNSKLFRDVQKVGQRKIVSVTPGQKVVEVEQLGEIRVLWIRKTFSTFIRVSEDKRDPDHQIIIFTLMRSDVLAEFEGRWDLKTVKDEAGNVVATEAELNQNVMPKGIPGVFKHIPVLSGLMRKIAMASIRRIMEDVDAAVIKIKAAMSTGRSLADVMCELCGPCAEEGHANGDVASFAFTPGEEVVDSEEEEAEEEREQQEQQDMIRQAEAAAAAAAASTPAAAGAAAAPEVPAQQVADLSLSEPSAAGVAAALEETMAEPIRVKGG